MAAACILSISGTCAALDNSLILALFYHCYDLCAVLDRTPSVSSYPTFVTALVVLLILPYILALVQHLSCPYSFC